MNFRTIFTLLALLLVTAGSIWFISRKQATTYGEPRLDTLIIGTNTDYPPFSTVEHDHIVGFDIDVALEVAKRLGKPYSLNAMSFDALIPELQVGSIHLIAAGVTPTPERANRVYFVTPHLEGDPLMAIQKKDAAPIQKKEQLKGKVVIVNQGYSSDNVVSDIPNIGEVIRISSPQVSTGLMALDANPEAVYVASKSALQPFLEKRHAGYTVSTLEGTAEPYAIAVSKKYPELFTKIQDIVTEMKRDGTIAALKEKWKLNG